MTFLECLSCAIQMRVQIDFCVETTPVDDNCTSEWDRYNNLAGHGSTLHHSATTLVECQTACEFDPRCVFVDWAPSHRRCWINRISNHRHFTSTHFEHYELISRCNITSGQCSERCSSLMAFIWTCWKLFKSVESRLRRWFWGKIV